MFRFFFPKPRCVFCFSLFTFRFDTIFSTRCKESVIQAEGGCDGGNTDSSIPPVFIHIFFLSFFSVTRNRRGRKIKKKKIKKKKNSAPGIFVSVFGSFFFFLLLSFPSKHNYSSGFEQNIHLSARVSDDDPPRAALLFFFLSPFFEAKKKKNETI